MSDLSDKVFGPEPAVNKPAAVPSAKKPSTPVAPTPAKPTVPFPSLSLSSQVTNRPHTEGGSVSPTRGSEDPITQQILRQHPELANVRNATSTALGAAGNVFETPFSILGALARDEQTGATGPQSASSKVGDLLMHGKFGEAATQYSPTSWQAVRTLAQGGGPIGSVAQAAVAHPRIASLAMGASEFLNPANAITGEALGAAGRATKTALTEGGKAVSSAVSKVNPNFVGTPVHRAMQSLGETATGSRFGSVRQAATDLARERGANPAEATVSANKADLLGRQMAESRKIAEAQATPITNAVMKGLSPQEKLDLVDYIEDPTKSTSWTDFSGGKARQVTISPELQKRANIYLDARRDIDQRQIEAGLPLPFLEPSGSMGYVGRMRQESYFPRRNFSLDPNIENSEEATIRDLELGASRSRGGNNIRVDTLSENIPPRKYASRRQAAMSGVKMNPDWDPAEALQQHLVTRFNNTNLIDALRGFQDLGLIVPKETTNIWNKAIPYRSDFLPFTDIGTVRQFGLGASKYLQNSAVHPSIRNLIEDLGPQTSSGGLPSVVAGAGKGLGAVNELAARATVANPIYHVPVNIIPRTIGTALTYGMDPLAYGKALLNPKSAIAEAREAGASFPSVGSRFNAKALQPWSSLTPLERVGRVGGTVGRSINAVTNDLLYKYLQPPLEAAAYAGLKSTIGPEAAALKVRKIVGEPENIGGAEKAIGQALIFPGWLKSEARVWGDLLKRNPALYFGPQAGGRAYNESQGVSPTAQDQATMFPSLVQRIDPKTGEVTKWTPPITGNRVVGVANALGSMPKQGLKPIVNEAVKVLNPALGFAARAYGTGRGAATNPSYNVVYDKDAPVSEQLKQSASTFVNRYNTFAPDLNAPSNIKKEPFSLGTFLGSFVGYEPEQYLTPKEDKANYKIEQFYRSWIHQLARDAQTLQQKGQVEKAAALTEMHDQLWYAMRAMLAARQAVPNSKEAQAAITDYRSRIEALNQATRKISAPSSSQQQPPMSQAESQ